MSLRIVVSGMIAADPYQGGATWAVLQYLLGFRQLGHDVWFVDPVPPSAIRPEGHSFDASKNAAYFHDVRARFNLTDRAALLRQDTRETVGLSYAALCRATDGADLLINISGMLTDPELVSGIERRVYLDLDPAFNQLWHVVEGIDVHLDGHTHFVTVGTAIGTADSDIPTCGRDWITTWQPIVLDEWPWTESRRDGPWTTIGNWRGYGSIHYNGVLYGQKAHSLRQFVTLPRKTSDAFLLALAIHRDEVKDLAALADNGWSLVDPACVAATPDAYRNFIQGSKGEFGIAKTGYVVSRSGWFSDRSVCYLATGRPVVAQSTGFERRLPTGRGLFAFSTEQDVLAAIDAINADYETHAAAARALAEDYFDSRTVLARLLEQVGA